MKYNPAVVGAFFKEMGLPPHVREFHFGKAAGYISPKTGKVGEWRFDFAWLDSKVALEVQGGGFIRGGHTRGGGQIDDMIKFNAAIECGWVVLQCVPKNICTVDLAEMIKRVISKR